MTENKFAILPADAIFDQRLSPAEFHTLAAICYHGAQKPRGCWPSYATVASELAVDRRTIMRHMSKLCTYGYLVKEQRKRENGSATSNLYRVNFDIVVEHTVDTPDIVVGGDTDVTGGGDTGDTRVVAGMSPPKEEQENLNSTINIKNTRGRKTKKITLAEWEKQQGNELNIHMFKTWGQQKKLNPRALEEMIEAFRDAVNGSGLLAADFVATFKNWLRRGFLPKTLEQVTLPISQSTTKIIDRGLSI